MQRIKNIKTMALLAALSLPVLLARPAFASDGNVVQVQTFIKSVIGVISLIAGGLAALFIIIGGIHYITSSGNPERLDKAKHTLLYASIGLVIVFGAFVFVSIVSDLATNAFGK